MEIRRHWFVKQYIKLFKIKSNVKIQQKDDLKIDEHFPKLGKWKNDFHRLN